jgi:hypothetical protein
MMRQGRSVPILLQKSPMKGLAVELKRAVVAAAPWERQRLTH